jgi:hypothetical protein
MARASFRATALAVAASLLVACADARADAGAPLADHTIGGAEQSSPAKSQPPVTQTEGGTVEEGALDGGAMGSQQQSVQSQQQPDEPPADSSPVQQQAPAGASGPAPGPTSPGAPENPAPDLAVEPLGASAASAPEPPGAARSALDPATALPMEPESAGEVPGSFPLGKGPEPKLAGVERRKLAEPARTGRSEAALTAAEPGGNAALTQVQSAPGVAPRHTTTAPLERPATRRPATRPEGRRGPGAVPPWSSSSPSASASAGGAFSSAAHLAGGAADRSCSTPDVGAPRSAGRASVHGGVPGAARAPGVTLRWGNPCPSRDRDVPAAYPRSRGDSCMRANPITLRASILAPRAGPQSPDTRPIEISETTRERP